MKKLTLAVAASFTLLSFSAVAGGDCQYGHKAKVAESTADTEIDTVDPKLLALMKKEQEEQALTKPIPTFN